MLSSWKYWECELKKIHEVLNKNSVLLITLSSLITLSHGSNKGGLWLVPTNISLFSTKAYVPALVRDLVRKFYQVMDHDLIVIEYSKKLCRNEYQTLSLTAALISFSGSSTHSNLIPHHDAVYLFFFNCYLQEAALGSMRIIKDYLDDSILKTLVLPRAKSLFNKSDNIKVCYSGPVCMESRSPAANIISDQTTPSPRISKPCFPLRKNVC